MEMQTPNSYAKRHARSELLNLRIVTFRSFGCDSCELGFFFKSGPVPESAVSMAAVEKNVGEQNIDYLTKGQLRVGVGSSYFVKICIPPVLLTGKF